MADLLSESNDRSYRATILAIAVLGAMVALVIFVPELRALAGDTRRELRSISRRWIAAIVIARIGQAIFSAISWQNALNAAFPYSRLRFGFVLGLDQGQDALNTLTPARGGTITLLAALHVRIRGATMPKLLGVAAVQNLPFLIIGIVLAAVISIGLPDRVRDDGGFVNAVSGFIRDHPVWTGVIVTVVVIAVLAAFHFARAKIEHAADELKEGMALIGSPVRFFRLLVVPASISYAFRWLTTMFLLAAFDIPVTFWSTALAVGSNAASGAVRLTPGGIGPSQALDVIALSSYAEPEVVTAFSLASLATSAIVSGTLAIIGLLSARRWSKIGERRHARHKPPAG